jgi:hypothetical protein
MAAGCCSLTFVGELKGMTFNVQVFHHFGTLCSKSAFHFLEFHLTSAHGNTDTSNTIATGA